MFLFNINWYPFELEVLPRSELPASWKGKLDSGLWTLDWTLDWSLDWTLAWTLD